MCVIVCVHALSNARSYKFICTFVWLRVRLCACMFRFMCACACSFVCV